MSSTFNKLSLYKPAAVSERFKSPEPLNPRKEQPQPSPNLTFTPPPTQSLSLSDNEHSSLLSNEPHINSTLKDTQGSSVSAGDKTVLVVQAIESQTHLSSPEIPVTTVETPSPVSVIRHSPPPPPPPLSSVSGTHEHRFSSDFVHPSSFKEPLLFSKSAAVAARGKPGLSLAQHIEEEGESDFSEEDQKCNGVVSATSSSSTMRELLGEELQRNVEKDNIQDEDKDTEVLQHQSDQKHTHNGGSEVKENESKRTKKKGTGSRFVASRYMTGVGNLKKEKPSSGHVSVRNNNKSILKSVKRGALSQSVSNASFNPSHSYTSTPAVKPPPRVRTGEPPKRTNTANQTTVIGQARRRQQHLQSNGQTNAGKSAGRPLEATSKQGMLNSRLLQMTYLRVKAARAKKLQEAQAQSQLYSLWEACEDKKREVTELVKELEYCTRTRSIDESLSYQMKGLSELDEKLTSIQSDHSVLSQSLDSTLHELPTKHVIITNEDDLVEAVTEAETCSREVAIRIGDSGDKTTDLADKVESLAKMVKREQDEVERLQAHLHKTTKLQIHETSLYHEKIQYKKTSK